MTKGFAPLLIAAVLVAVFAFVLGTGLIDFKAPAELLTLNDVSSCKLAEAEFFTLKCDPAGNAVPTTYTWDASFRVETVETSITSYRTVSGATAALKDIWGNTICSISNTGSDCQDKNLITGQTYNYKVVCSVIGCYEGTPKLDVSGRYLFLTYSDTRGLSGVVLPSTQNCISNDFTKDFLGISQLTGVAVDSSVGKSITLQQGQTSVQFRMYRGVDPINYAYTYNNQPAVCDMAIKKLYGYTKITAPDGSCYGIADKANIFIDGTTRPYFCCSDSVCQVQHGLSSEYKCNNYECKKAESTVQCLTDSECGYLDQYITGQNGITIFRKGFCSAGTCRYNDKQIACNPSLSYPNNQCCKKDMFGNYKLEQCTVPLQLCEQLGADACCLSSQSKYTLKNAPAGKYCCDQDNDGVGKVTNTQAECNRDIGGFNLLGLLGKFLSNLLGGLIIAAIIMIVLAMLALLGVAAFLRFILKPSVFILLIIIIALLLAIGFTGLTAQVATMVMS